jgi:serine/threonine protein kinase
VNIPGIVQTMLMLAGLVPVGALAFRALIPELEKFSQRRAVGERRQEELPQRAGMLVATVNTPQEDHFAHEHGLVHRDVKPSNMLVTKDGTAKLADLGLARQCDSDLTVLTHTGTGMGTPAYMAPEQITDARRADPRSDIYSLGATWYHMVTGRPPFAGATAIEVCQKHLSEPPQSPRSLRPELPRADCRTIERMLAKKPDQRFQTARELCRAITEECLTPAEHRTTN